MHALQVCCAQRWCAPDAQVSPRSIASHPRSGGLGGPCRGEAGRAVTDPVIPPTPASITSLLLRPLPGTCTEPGHQGGEGSGSGAGRILYIACQGGAWELQPAAGQGEANGCPRCLPSLPRLVVPTVSLQSRAVSAAPGGVLCRLSAHREETGPGLGKRRAGVRMKFSLGKSWS